MSNGITEPLHVAPRFNGMIASGITTAGAAGIALIWITAYAASPHRPAITAGITAISAVAASVGATLLIIGGALRIVMGALTEMRNERLKDKRAAAVKLAAIQKSVDDHGHNVLVDHNALHRDALSVDEHVVQIREELTEVRGLLALLRHEEQSDRKRPHTPRQRKHRRGSAVAAGDNVIPLGARRAADALRRLTEQITDEPNA
jgi:hypothetical protein